MDPGMGYSWVFMGWSRGKVGFFSKGGGDWERALRGAFDGMSTGCYALCWQIEVQYKLHKVQYKMQKIYINK